MLKIGNKRQKLLLVLIGALISNVVFAQKATVNFEMTVKFPKDARILFQGDSITDGGRARNLDPNHILGHSYAFLIAAPNAARFPEMNWTFLNRGISGDKITDLAARWEKDTIELKPDYLSILVGINDTASYIENRPNARNAEDFEKIYDELLRETKEKLPNVKFILGDSFIYPVGGFKKKFSIYQEETKKRRDAIERLAAKYKAPIVHYQKIFDDVQKQAPIEYWVWDGVHPSFAGHQLMAAEWVRVVNEFYFGKKSKNKK